MTLRNRITIAICMILLALTAGLLYFARTRVGEVEQRLAVETNERHVELWRELAKGLFEKLDAERPVLELSYEVRAALRDRDDAALGKYGGLAWSMLEAGSAVGALELTGMDGRVVYSSTEDEMTGLTERLARRAVTTGKYVSAIAPDRSGRPVAKLAFPLSMSRKIIGAGVYVAPLDGVIQKFAESSGSDVFIVQPGGALSYATDESHPALASLEMDETGGRQALSSIVSGDRAYEVALQPFGSTGAESAASLVVIRDRTDRIMAGRRTSWIALGATAFFVLLTLTVLSLYIKRSLRPLEVATQSMRRLAGGCLDVHVPEGGTGEIGHLNESMRFMVKRLASIMGEVHGASAALTSHSAYLNELAEHITQVLRDHRSRSAQVASSSTQMASTIIEIAANASEVTQFAHNATTLATGGADIVSRTASMVKGIHADAADAMTSIGQLHGRSREVEGIIKTINEITDQTNLLALNAAIEAARAGEAGRGFSVVADEVRKLAEKTNRATAEVEEMVHSIQVGAESAAAAMRKSLDRVRGGVALSEEAGSTLAEIVLKAKGLEMNIHGIATATEQLSAGTEQINSDIAHADTGAHLALGKADEILSTSSRLALMAGNLNETLALFNGAGHKGGGAQADRGLDAEAIIADVQVVDTPPRDPEDRRARAAV